MAEDLGQAQLTLTVNLDKFREDLRNAKRLVASELGDVGTGTGTSRGRRPGSQQSAAAAESRAQRARERRVRDEQRELARRARQGGARENTRALEIAQEKRFRIARRIDDLEERGADVARLRNRLGQLTEAQSKRQFGTFRQISQELARQVTLEERRVGAQRRQQRAQQQQARLGAQNGGARESINALQNAQDRRFRLSQRINRLEERGVRVDKLRSQLGDLTTSYANRQFGSAKQLSRELGRQVTLTEARARREREAQRAVDRRTRAEQAATARSARIGGPRSPIQGSRSIPDSPAFLDAQRKRQARDLSRAARIGGPREPIQGRRDLEGSPAFIREQVKRSTDIYKKFVEQQARELTRAARAGGPSEPIRGRADLPGSPAAIQADRRARASAAREEQRRRREEAARLRAQRAEELRIARGNASPVSGLLPGGIRIPGSPAAKGRELNIRNNWKLFLDQLVETKAAIEAESTRASSRLRSRGGARRLGPASPISGRLFDGSAVPGSPAALADSERKLAAERRKAEAATRQLTKQEQKRAKARREQRGAGIGDRFSESIGNAIIGGAFPALFGQGAAASAGGALGGALGGLFGGNFGFGLSLVGTAIGQTVDNLTKALESPVENFDLIKQSALLSSKSLEKFAEGLIATGRVSEADAVIQQDLSKTYGPQNLKSLDELRAKNDELSRSWARLSASIGALLVGPLSGLANLFGGLSGGPTDSANRVSDSQFTAELRQIEKEFGRNAASDVARFKFFNNQVAPLPNERLPQLIERQNKAALDYAERQGYITKEVKKAKAEELAFEERIAAARQQTNVEYSNSLRLISAQVQGNRTAQLDQRANAVNDRRNQALRVLDSQRVPDNDPRRIEANKTASRELYRIEEERLQLQKEIARTIEQEAIKRQQIAQQLAATTARRDAALAAADSGANPGNSILAARAGELEGASFLAQNRLRVEQAITRERELQAQLAQESDPTRRSQLAEQLRTAADEIRLAGEDAGAALAERAASAAQSLRSAQDSLRNTLQSNFRLLPRAQRQSLLDSARADVERGRQSGILRPNFGAAGRRRTFEAADFVRNVEQQRAQVAQQQALVDALNANTNAERNIRINVTMNADGTASVFQTEQQAALL